MKFAAVKKIIGIMMKTVKWGFIVFCVFIGSLFFREQKISSDLVEHLFNRVAPTNLVLSVDYVSFGFRHGIHLRDVRLSDANMKDVMHLIAGADSVFLHPFSRCVRIEGARYTRLPDRYYVPENQEKNAPVAGGFPTLGKITLELIDPDILAVRPRKVTAKIEVSARRIDVKDIHLCWPDADRPNMTIDGWCFLDLDEQIVHGKVEGVARQAHIRPLLETLDVPVALPYMDAFTEIPEPCLAGCELKVNLFNNDLDLWLDLHPVMGRYNEVPMKRADGRIHLHNYTRGNCLNYKTIVGPISAVDINNRTLAGSVVITGTNGYNVVDVSAKSTQPLADLLRIGGFTGEYVSEDVFGESSCTLQFRFPRAMTNNYEVLNGHGSVSIKNGQLMRLKGFKGLLDAMPAIAPAISWISDSTQASCDYVIKDGVLYTDNIYIEGTLFSIKMDGSFDAVRDKLNFNVLVQFTKKDSLLGKVVRPLAWPFSKLLLAFRLTGTSENPKWIYLSVIKRILEAVE